MLAGYTPHHSVLTPEDVSGADLSMRAVLSYYGPADMRTFYHDSDWGHLMRPDSIILTKVDHSHFLQRLLPGGNSPERMNMAKAFKAFPHLFPGAPDEMPEWFALVSPVEHVQRDCPTTLLLHGSNDAFVSPAPTRVLAEKLRTAGVTTMCVIYPWAEHAFDALPRWSPAAQVSYYDVDHFLALMA